MTAISQGLKGGLAAGAIYGLMIGLLHLFTLEGCESYILVFISGRLASLVPPSNATAIDLFQTDLVYNPMVYGIWALIYGVIFGLVFGLAINKIPGSSARKKGVFLGLFLFVADFLVGPGFFIAYACGTSVIPYLALGLSLPASLGFGYLLGVFFDSFGRLEKEETDERKAQEKNEHWSDYFRRKKTYLYSNL
ncbi:MAG: hypothetical protein ACYCQJ_04650 [Nitrososphaerales archaeon]